MCMYVCMYVCVCVLWVDKDKPMTMTHLVGNGDKVCVYVCVYVCVCVCALGG